MHVATYVVRYRWIDRQTDSNAGFVKLRSRCMHVSMCVEALMRVSRSLKVDACKAHISTCVRALTSRATHVESLFSQNCNIFSVSSIFKYNPGEINLLFLSNFYPVILLSTRAKGKRRIICSIRFGHSLWSANQLPTQGVKEWQLVPHAKKIRLGIVCLTLRRKIRLCEVCMKTEARFWLTFIEYRVVR